MVLHGISSPLRDFTRQYLSFPVNPTHSPVSLARDIAERTNLFVLRQDRDPTIMDSAKPPLLDHIRMFNHNKAHRLSYQASQRCGGPETGQVLTLSVAGSSRGTGFVVCFAFLLSITSCNAANQSCALSSAKQCRETEKTSPDASSIQSMETK